MARPASTQPTEVELQILQILWEHGPSPVRVIHQHLAAQRDTNYSTTVKMLGVMLEKGMLTRTEGERPHIYRPAVSKRKAQTGMLNDLIRKIYGGSSASLILQALSEKKTTPEELTRIKALIEQLEEHP